MRQIWIDGEYTDLTDDDDPPEYHIETGGIRFDDYDWPGFFLRGDDALYVASLISSMHARSGSAEYEDLENLMIYANQIFAEVPFEQWVDERGHSMIAAKPPEELKRVAAEAKKRIRVERSGIVTREDNKDEKTTPDV